MNKVRNHNKKLQNAPWHIFKTKIPIFSNRNSRATATTRSALSPVSMQLYRISVEDVEVVPAALGGKLLQVDPDPVVGRRSLDEPEADVKKLILLSLKLRTNKLECFYKTMFI